MLHTFVSFRKFSVTPLEIARWENHSYVDGGDGCRSVWGGDVLGEVVLVLVEIDEGWAGVVVKTALLDVSGVCGEARKTTLGRTHIRRTPEVLRVAGQRILDLSTTVLGNDPMTGRSRDLIFLQTHLLELSPAWLLENLASHLGFLLEAGSRLLQVWLWLVEFLVRVGASQYLFGVYFGARRVLATPQASRLLVKVVKSESVGCTLLLWGLQKLLFSWNIGLVQVLDVCV